MIKCVQVSVLACVPRWRTRDYDKKIIIIYTQNRLNKFIKIGSSVVIAVNFKHTRVWRFQRVDVLFILLKLRHFHW